MPGKTPFRYIIKLCIESYMYLQTICYVLWGFEYIKTGEHVLVGYFDDSQHDLLSLFKLQFDHELAGKVIFLS